MPFLEKMPSPKDATSPLICVDCKVCTILFPGKKKTQTFKVILIAGKESCNVICVIVLCSAGIWKTVCSYLSLLSLHQDSWLHKGCLHYHPGMPVHPSGFSYFFLLLAHLVWEMLIKPGVLVGLIYMFY